MLRYSSPLLQVVIVGFVLLMTSGMFNALNGMGGGGQLAQNASVAANANVALYTLFSVGGLVAGGIVNMVGPRFAMAAGGATYALYAGSLLNYNHDSNAAFTIASGAILGLGAALLWTGQGAIITSYPSEHNKGKYIGIFWAIFNLGAVLGSIIPLALNWNSQQGSVNDGTYIGFIVLMAVGAISALALLPPSKVYHKDGRPVTVQKLPSWKNETIEIAKLFLDWRMILLAPMFLASNWFYAYQFNDMNAFYFNVRTRAFNELWYWLAQIVGALLFGGFLDSNALKRKNRAVIGLAMLTVCIMAIWTGGLIFQLSYKREDIITPMDLFDSGYGGKMVLYLFYGLLDAMYQCYAYWIMGALSNDTERLSRYAGFYKAVQSAGAAMSWRIDAVNTAFLPQLIVCWALLAFSIGPAMVVAFKIKDTNYDEKGAVESTADKVVDEKEKSSNAPV